MAVDTKDLTKQAELDPQKALDALQINNGDMALTVERLGVSKAVFVRALTAVPAETFATIRMATVLRAFDTMRILGEHMTVEAAGMDGSELARALQSMMGHVETLTRSQAAGTGGGSVINVLLQHVPREAANAIKGVASMDMDDLHDMRRLLKMRDEVNHPDDADFKEVDD